MDKDDPEAFVSIGYFTDTINVGETLGLTVEQAREGCEGENYEWIEANGVGSLDAETGLNVIYTAPETGNNCPGNAEIQLICGGEVVDTLIITINYNYAISFVYPDPETEIGQNDSLAINVEANGTPLTWEVSGTGFSLEHEETAGTGNVLHSSGSACGAAIITITDCDGNVAIGSVRCTTGQWVFKSNDVCRLAGGGEFVDKLTTRTLYRRIQGYQKQETRMRASGTGVGYYGCWDPNTNCVNPCDDCLDWSCDEIYDCLGPCGDCCCYTYTGDDPCGGGETYRDGKCIEIQNMEYWEWEC